MLVNFWNIKIVARRSFSVMANSINVTDTSPEKKISLVIRPWQNSVPWTLHAMHLAFSREKNICRQWQSVHNITRDHWCFVRRAPSWAGSIVFRCVRSSFGTNTSVFSECLSYHSTPPLVFTPIFLGFFWLWSIRPFLAAHLLSRKKPLSVSWTAGRISSPYVRRHYSHLLPKLFWLVWLINNIPLKYHLCLYFLSIFPP